VPEQELPLVAPGVRELDHVAQASGTGDRGVQIPLRARARGDDEEAVGALEAVEGSEQGGERPVLRRARLAALARDEVQLVDDDDRPAPGVAATEAGEHPADGRAVELIGDHRVGGHAIAEAAGQVARARGLPAAGRPVEEDAPGDLRPHRRGPHGVREAGDDARDLGLDEPDPDEGLGGEGGRIDAVLVEPGVRDGGHQRASPLSPVGTGSAAPSAPASPGSSSAAAAVARRVQAREGHDQPVRRDAPRSGRDR